MQKKYVLNKNWRFKLDKTIGEVNRLPTSKITRWLPAEVPGNVHTDLLSNKIIDDPFYADNEHKVKWISECSWIYTTTFDFPQELENNRAIDLVFEGIDTIAETFLNGKLIGKSENMFIKYQFDVSKILVEKANELTIKLYSPVLYSQSEEKKYGKLPVALNSSRVYIRKAQYSFGWDWGPSFPTMGIWRSVYLLQNENAIIENVHFSTIQATQQNASIKTSFEISGDVQNLNANISLRRESFSCEKKILVSGGQKLTQEFTIENPSLWYPNGSGEQNLYDLRITLHDSSGKVCYEVNKKVGVRKIELILNENGNSTFHFKINGEKIFARGFNWIPADSFLPRIKESKYDTLLKYAKDASANIIRVWGGGIYEDEHFYETCDQLGLLVWQDFMFACGAYPEHEKFLELVKEEVIQNVKRLRSHSCMAIFCGNNENEWIWHQQTGLAYQKMPGYKIFGQLIPELVTEYAPEIAYWESSPFGLDNDPNSYASGNRHEWGIWSRWIDYTEVRKDQSLFVTEFGFQGPANRYTLEKYLPKINQKIHDPIFEMHNKQIEGPERIIKFLSAHLPVSSNWKNFFYLTQFNQALAVKTCVEHWRNNFPHTNGSIIWQLNDCWPVTSWAVIDSELKLKMAYFLVKNIFSNCILAFSEENNELIINALNNSFENFTGRIKINKIIGESGVVRVVLDKKVMLSKNSKNCLVRIPLENKQNEMNTIYLASLYNKTGDLIFRNYHTSTKLKYLKFVQPKIKLEILEEDKNKFLQIKTDKPVFLMDVVHPKLQFSDRGFILLSNEKKNLLIEGNLPKNFKLSDLEIYHLNQFLS